MNGFKSKSKSSSIRDIENKYGINLSTCTRHQLDLLTSRGIAKSKLCQILC